MSKKADSPKSEVEIATDDERLAIVVEERLQAEISTAKEELELAEARRKAAEHDLSDEANFTYLFDADVNGKSARKFIRQMHAWGRSDDCNRIVVALNTPGGSCPHGFAMVDTMLAIRSSTPVSGYVRGRAQSMGAILLQACTDRFIGPNSSLLVHEGSLWTGGTTNQVGDHMELMDIWNNRMLDMLSERAFISREEIAERWRRKDWHMGAQEAVELGFADAVW